MNAGTWSGRWSDQESGPVIESINPSTGEWLARVRGATAADYERVLSSAVEAAQQWRTVPAPKRGEAVRADGGGTASAQRRAR